MSAILIIVLSAFLSTGLFLTLWLIFRKKWYLSLLLSLFSLLALLFIFDLKLKWTVSKKGYPPLYILMDNSLSQGLNKGKLLTALPEDQIFYFPEAARNTRTALHDNISSVLDKIEASSKLLVISDFQDNSSYLKSKPDPRVIPMIYEDHHQDQSSIIDCVYTEKLQSGTKNSWELSLYSSSSKTVALHITDGISLNKKISLKLQPGINTRTVAFPLYGEGYRLLKFRLVDQADPWISNNTFQILHHILPGTYKILLVAGRPSPELARFQRFLNELKWIELDSTVLVKRNESYPLPSLSRLHNYDTIIIMDIIDRQLTHLDRLGLYKKKMLYIPGMQSLKNNSALRKMFSVTQVSEKFQETKVKIKGSARVINTAYQAKNYLTTGRHVVFLGWDTWKWDFTLLALNLDLNTYPSFWKNIIIDLIDQKESHLFQEKLNYQAGEKNPLRKNASGLYTVYTNEKKSQYFVQPAYHELALLHADREQALSYNSNIYFLDQSLNWPLIKKRLRPAHKTVWDINHEFGIRNNILVFILMILLISAYWLLSDRLILKS